jgi:hypothetical protein
MKAKVILLATVCTAIMLTVIGCVNEVEVLSFADRIQLPSDSGKYVYDREVRDPPGELVLHDTVTCNVRRIYDTLESNLSIFSYEYLNENKYLVQKLMAFDQDKRIYLRVKHQFNTSDDVDQWMLLPIHDSKGDTEMVIEDFSVYWRYGIVITIKTLGSAVYLGDTISKVGNKNFSGRKFEVQFDRDLRGSYVGGNFSKDVGVWIPEISYFSELAEESMSNPISGEIPNSQYLRLLNFSR